MRQNYTLALDEEGRVYSMGKGKTGVLSLASTMSSAFPYSGGREGGEDELRLVSCRLLDRTEGVKLYNHYSMIQYFLF